MKSVEQAWREYGVDEDMPVHDFFLAGWDAAIEAMAGVQEQLDLALGTLESRDREIEHQIRAFPLLGELAAKRH